MRAEFLSRACNHDTYPAESCVRGNRPYQFDAPVGFTDYMNRCRTECPLKMDPINCRLEGSLKT